MAYTNIWENLGLHRVFTGNITGCEVFESNIELHSDRRFQEIDYIINDFSDISGHSIDSDHTEIYAHTDEIISRTKHRLKVALVVPHPSARELALNYCRLMEGRRFHCEVFETIVDARVWVTG